jgi:hypothetical protein
MLLTTCQVESLCTGVETLPSGVATATWPEGGWGWVLVV